MSTPLHIACEEGRYDAARQLIDQGADIEARDDIGWKPIHLASRYGHEMIVDILLRNGARINTQTVDLDNSDSDGNNTSLHLAAHNKQYKVAKRLLSNDACTEIGDSWSAATPLHIAVEEKDPEMVRILLEHGANMHYKDYPREGPCRSPLEHVIKKGYTSILRVMMTNATRNDVNIALSHARRYKRKRATDYLRSIR